MHGGSRTGAGRKAGFAAKNAEEARRYLSERVAMEMASLTDALLKKALEGDMRAMQILMDRAWGKPRQEIQLTSREEKQEVSPRILELARKLNSNIQV